MSITIDLQDSGEFLLTDETGHAVSIPSSLSGLLFLKGLLASRRQYTGTPHFGSPGRPTQAMVNAYLSTHKVERVAQGTAKQIADRNNRAEQKALRERERMKQYGNLSLDLELDL